MSKRGFCATVWALGLLACAPRTRARLDLPAWVSDAARRQAEEAFAILANAPRIELRAIERGATSDSDAVLDSVTLETSAERAVVVERLRQALQRGGAFALCFHPHHALVVVDGRRQIQVRICLSCLQAEIRDSSTSEVFVLPIDPSALVDVVSAPIEAKGHLRFVPFDDEHRLGYWQKASGAPRP